MTPDEIYFGSTWSVAKCDGLRGSHRGPAVKRASRVIHTTCSTAAFVKVADPDTFNLWSQGGAPLEDCKPIGADARHPGSF